MVATHPGEVRAMKRLAFALLLAGVGSGCHQERMTSHDCGLILDRITELELVERGFRDPALAARRKGEMRSRLKGELDACVGRIVKRGAMACALTASTTEDLTQRCLR
jgi:hypothetical protein